MLKKIITKKILVSSLCLFALFLIYMIPKDTVYTLKDIKQEVNYVTENENLKTVFLMDQDGMLGKTEYISSDMKRDELWLEKIKKQLNDYSEPIPQDGWEKLQQALSEVPQATPSVRKQKLIPIRKWSVVAAAAAVLVGVSLVSLWLVQSQWVDNVRQDSISLQANTSQSVQLHPEEVKQQMIDDIDVVRVKESQQESVRSRQIAQVIPNVLETIEEDIDEELATQEGDIEETAEPERKVEQSVRKQKRNSLYSAQEQYEHVNSLKKHKSWSVGLSINSTGGATNLGNEGGVNIIQQSPNGYIGENISFSNTSTGLVSIPEGQELVFKERADLVPEKMVHVVYSFRTWSL